MAMNLRILGFLILGGLACAPPGRNRATPTPILWDPPCRQVVDRYPYRLTVQYLPPSYRARREVNASSTFESLEPASVAEELATKRQTLVFLVKVGPHPDLPPGQRRNADLLNPDSGQPAFSGILHDLYFELGNRVFLMSGEGKRIPPLHWQVDRNWGIGFSTRLLFYFPRERRSGYPGAEGPLDLVIRNLTAGIAEVRLPFSESDFDGCDRSPETPLASQFSESGALPRLP